MNPRRGASPCAPLIALKKKPKQKEPEKVAETKRLRYPPKVKKNRTSSLMSLLSMQ
ncbi:hypothetical protein [Candidatus Hamiltonella defensa]|uniref:hypothetical protein n=1 Tax=Candidatus Williamhamiltonella defendens TaxID=138072 RepID=UPI001581D2DF|nr:hypothetical protein [Candidatus Hamiltonella defensa]